MSLCLVWMLRKSPEFAEAERALPSPAGRQVQLGVSGERLGLTPFSAAAVLGLVISPLSFSAFKKLLFVRSTKTNFHEHFSCSGGEGAAGAVTGGVPPITSWVLTRYSGG